MDIDFAKLDDAIDAAGADGFFVEESGANSDQRYLSGFDAPDPFATLYVDGCVQLLVRGLERGRARAESRAETVATPSTYDFGDLYDRYGQPDAGHRMHSAFLKAFGVDSVLVPDRFPLGLADGLRTLDHAVIPDTDGTLARIRAVKSATELEHIRGAQRGTERAMAAAETVLDGATIESDGTLVADGAPLTSERVRAEIDRTLLDEGCAPEDTIVAGGEGAADPHHRGSGPLSAGEPIVIDIFPADDRTGYHADMTRTFVVGDPADEAREWYDLVLSAQRAALDAIEPGITGSAVHDATCAVFEEAGVPTTRSDEDTETGFIHGTGHGVGLDVHERPSLNARGREALEPGNVVTVEPGLYDPTVGGIRIEDLVVVTDTGCENLTNYHKDFVIG